MGGQSYPQQGVMSTYQLSAHNHSGIGQGGLVDPTVINHDALLNFVGAEHLSLPNTLINVLTDHNKVAHDALNIDADTVDGIDIPNTIANVLTNHTKAVHDALLIELLGNNVCIGVGTPVWGNTRLTVQQNAESYERGIAVVASGGLADGAIIMSIVSPDMGSIQVADNVGWQDLTLQPQGGNVYIGVGDLFISSATSKITGGTKFWLEAGGNGIASATIHGDTTANAGDVEIADDPSYMIRRSTSAKQYKDKIKDLELDSSLIYNLHPVSFNSVCKDDDKKKRFVGLVAEEIFEILPSIVKRSSKGEIRSYDNQMLMTLILAEVQNINTRVSALEN